MKLLVTVLFIFSFAGCVVYDLKSERDKMSARPFYVNEKSDFINDAEKNLIDKPQLSRFSDFKKCYQDESRKNNSLNGRVVVFFLINDQGKVNSSKIMSTTLKNKDVEDCLIETLNAMTFKPTPAGTVAEITYPFVFISSKLDENK